VYKYDYDMQQLKCVNPSLVYRDRLAQQSGIKPIEVMKEQIFIE